MQPVPLPTPGRVHHWTALTPAITDGLCKLFLIIRFIEQIQTPSICRGPGQEY